MGSRTDLAGRTFDTKIHEAGDKGSGVITSAGLWRKKRGAGGRRSGIERRSNTDVQGQTALPLLATPPTTRHPHGLSLIKLKNDLTGAYGHLQVLSESPLSTDMEKRFYRDAMSAIGGVHIAAQVLLNAYEPKAGG